MTPSSTPLITVRFSGHSISSDVRMTGFRLGCGGKKDKLSPPGAKPTALVDEVSAPRGFGIRSYLHNFYLSPTVEDIEQSGAWCFFETSSLEYNLCHLKQPSKDVKK
ncbi:hypothetical protein ANCDUO_01691 [Ancylostoma duodenale]|uniref:Uncharacterized protein n=1 Tax=Ancylostoma duodenale TaxID=51022 RepID=A0A0C2DYA5_9BILA|nr:hypothetical protein ANCDUO_01691 [Ancylostoma duodenale]